MDLKKHIRLAEEKDVSILVGFNREMALETEGIVLESEILEKGVQAVLKNPEKGFYLVHEVFGTVRACLMVTFEWSDWRNGTFYWVQSVFVEKEFRQKGLYKDLYTFLQKHIKEKKNVAGLRLYVEKNNRRAQEVYKKLGMIETDYLLFEKSLNKQ